MSDIKLPFGRRDGVLVHISQVERGLACKCSCPGCNAPLVAKKGETAHHFAHKAKSDCTYQPESALHEYAKRLVAQQRTFTLPRLIVTVSHDDYRLRYSESLPEEVVAVQAGVEEQGFQDFVPDVQLDTSSGLIFVEIAVTHFVDHDKKEKLRRASVPTIEIDLSLVRLDASLEEIETTVLQKMGRRKWVFHPRSIELKALLDHRLQQELERIEQQLSRDNYVKGDEFDYDNPRDEEDREGWRLLKDAEDYSQDIIFTDALLREAPRHERLGIYKSLTHAEKIAYHCFLLKIAPTELPLVLNRIGGGGPFSCPDVVWKSGIYVKFVAKKHKPFGLGEVVDWCRERYEVFSFGMTEDEMHAPLKWQLSTVDREVFDFLAELEHSLHLESDGFVPRERRFLPRQPTW